MVCCDMLWFIADDGEMIEPPLSTGIASSKKEEDYDELGGTPFF